MTESITRILVPVEFSGNSEGALRYAAMLAGQVGASVELLHVVEDLSYGVLSEVYVPNVPDLMQETINDAVERLGALKASVFPHGSDVDTVAYVGRPAPTILDHAKAGGFDLIVMGTHGRTGLTHLFIGSVAEQVLRAAPCPVLTVRGHGAARVHMPAAPGKAA
jgi:nucleotide-binding universal stress UspA family protein